MDDQLAQALTHASAVPWVIGVGVIALVVSKFPGLIGDAGKAWTTYLESKRRAAELRDDADISDLRRQVEALSEETHRLRQEVADMRAETRRRDQILHEHYPWDVQAYQLIVEHLGPDAIRPPPPLWPLEPQTSMLPPPEVPS